MLDLWLIDRDDRPDEIAQAMMTLYMLEDGSNRPLGVELHDGTANNFQLAMAIADDVDMFYEEDVLVAERVWRLRDVCRRLGVTPKLVEVLDALTAGSGIEWPLTAEELAVLNPPLVWALNTYGSAVQQLLDCVTLGCLTRPPLED